MKIWSSGTRYAFQEAKGWLCVAQWDLVQRIDDIDGCREGVPLSLHSLMESRLKPRASRLKAQVFDFVNTVGRSRQYSDYMLARAIQNSLSQLKTAHQDSLIWEDEEVSIIKFVKPCPQCPCNGFPTPESIAAVFQIAQQRSLNHQSSRSHLLLSALSSERSTKAQLLGCHQPLSYCRSWSFWRLLTYVIRATSLWGKIRNNCLLIMLILRAAAYLHSKVHISFGEDWQ